MDTTSIFVLTAMFGMAAAFIGIGIYLARKHGGVTGRNNKDD